MTQDNLQPTILFAAGGGGIVVEVSPPSVGACVQYYVAPDGKKTRIVPDQDLLLLILKQSSSYAPYGATKVATVPAAAVAIRFQIGRPNHEPQTPSDKTSKASDRLSGSASGCPSLTRSNCAVPTKRGITDETCSVMSPSSRMPASAT